jgi:NTE family protein
MKFVLSGGGVRGFAHLGVLQALLEKGIQPEAIAATSAGSIVGAFIADGFAPQEIRELIQKNVGLGILFKWDNLRSGVITLQKFGDFMRKNLRHKRLESLPMPLFITATNFMDGSQKIFSTGDIVDAVMAASSIPGLFPPIVIDAIPYVDGGLCNNLPIEPFANFKQEVIAVHVNPIAPLSTGGSMLQVLDRTFHLSFVHMIKQSAEGCHLFIEPPELHQFALFDIPKLDAVYEVGYHYTKNLMAE